MTVIVTNVKKVVDFLTLAASVLAATGLAMIVCSYIYEVVSRYVFQSPTAWASDFVAYALCASAFLALPHVTKDKAHVAVTILVDIAPKPIANILHVIISILGFLCLSFAAWVSLQENIRQFYPWDSNPCHCANSAMVGVFIYHFRARVKRNLPAALSIPQTPR